MILFFTLLLIYDLSSARPFLPADKPEFYNAPLERFDIVEGESLVINLTARANPSAVTYSWTKDERRVATARATERSADRALPSVYARGSLLNLTNVERSHGGVYDCEAENSEGSTKTSILINIQCEAPLSSPLLVARPHLGMSTLPLRLSLRLQLSVNLLYRKTLGERLTIIC